MRIKDEIVKSNEDPKIMILDDEQGLVDVLKDRIAHIGYDAEGVTDADKAIEILRNEKYDILILDYHLVGILGDEVINRIREFDKDLYIILLTGFSSLPLKAIRELDIQAFCEKGLELDNILASVVIAARRMTVQKTEE